MHRRAFYAYAAVYVMAIKTKQCSFHSINVNYVSLNRKGGTVITMQTNYIFFNVYIVHEHLVEENVLTKTYLLANKIYCLYIPTALSLGHGEETHQA